MTYFIGLTLRHDQLLRRGVPRVEHSVQRIEVHTSTHVLDPQMEDENSEKGV